MGSFIGLAILLWTLALVRKDLIILKFGLPWIALSIFTIFFTIYPSFSLWLTKVFGFKNPSNLYFAVTVTSLISLGILLSIEVTRSVKRLEKAASAIAVIEGKISKN